MTLHRRGGSRLIAEHRILLHRRVWSAASTGGLANSGLVRLSSVTVCRASESNKRKQTKDNFKEAVESGGFWKTSFDSNCFCLRYGTSNRRDKKSRGALPKATPSALLSDLSPSTREGPSPLPKGSGRPAAPEPPVQTVARLYQLEPLRRLFFICTQLTCDPARSRVMQVAYPSRLYTLCVTVTSRVTYTPRISGGNLFPH
jgi:hypothetical protein